MKKKKPAKKKPFFPPMSFSYEGTQAVKTGTWRYLTPVYRDKLAPCNEGCPAGENIEEAMVLAGEEEPLGAWKKIMEENPLPRVCGRVCFHPCEGACNRGQFDEPVAINALERFLGDRAFQAGRRPAPPAQSRREKVAVIGSGPAGLSCAYHLASLGYAVTLFEARPQLGGVLRYGIPSYRLPKDVLDQEIANILSLGVEARTGTAVGGEIEWQDLGRFDAVFIAAGAWKSAPLGIPGEEAALSGLEFLRRVNSGEAVDPGKRVAVIGGGNTAMDAARCALRLGAKPLILYRRTREEMPAWAGEISEAEEESIEFIYLSSPVKILLQDGRVSAVECIKNLLGPPGPDGRREPQPITGSNFTLPVDAVIAAIGESPDFSFLPEGLHKAGGSLYTGKTGETSMPRVFAGGDITAQPRTVAYAIGSGKKAAMAIDASFRGTDPERALQASRWGGKGAFSMALYRGGAEDGHLKETAKYSEINPAYFKRRQRLVVAKLAPGARVCDFQEVAPGLAEAEALSEAGRCFHCGVCNFCHNCFTFCPDLAISARPDRKGYKIDLEYCKGCCICVEECPRGAISVEVKKS